MTNFDTLKSSEKNQHDAAGQCSAAERDMAVCNAAACTGCSQEQLDRIREKFSNDRFATEAVGITIEEVKPQYARCEMEIQPVHLNARGAVMGGAIFTLADFVGAVAANSCKETTDVVTLHSSITFLSPAKGTRLIGEAECLKDGRTTCLYEVIITDELGTKVAHATMNGFAVKK